MLETYDIYKREWPKKPTRPLQHKVETEFAFEKEQECYESPKKEQVSYVFKHLVANIKSYNADKI